MKCCPHIRIAALALLAMLASACAEQLSPLELVIATNQLRVGTLDVPGTFTADDSGHFGLEYTLTRAFAASLGVTPKYVVFATRKELLEAVSSGVVDLGAASLDMRAEDRTLVRFGSIYHREPMSAVYRRGQLRPRRIEDLSERKVRASTGHQSNTLPSPTTIDSPLEALRAVEVGETDTALVMQRHLFAARLVAPALRQGFAPGVEVPVAWAFPRVGDDALYHRAERWLLEHSRSGRVTDLHKVVDAHFPDFDHVAMLLWQRHLRSRFGEFESLFRDAAKRTGIDWRLLAAVAYQESHWKPRAVSPTGVRGLMMLTQATAAQMGVTSRIDPAQSIDGGSRYLAHLLARVPKKVELEGRVWFAVASYNIGRGHVADAMMLTTAHRKNAAYWHNVRRYLPLLEDANYHRLTRHGYARGREPVRYVGNIRRYFDALRWERFREKLRRRAESTN